MPLHAGRFTNSRPSFREALAESEAGRYEVAEQIYSTIIVIAHNSLQIVPTAVDTLFNALRAREWIYERLQKAEDVLNDAEWMMSLCPTRWEGYAAAAIAYRMLQKPDVCLGMLNLAIGHLGTDPGPELLEVLNRLKKARNDLSFQKAFASRLALPAAARRGMLSRFLSLPDRVLRLIFLLVQGMDPDSLVSLVCVCRRLRHVLTLDDNVDLWDRLVLTNRRPKEMLAIWMPLARHTMRELRVSGFEAANVYLTLRRALQREKDALQHRSRTCGLSQPPFSMESSLVALQTQPQKQQTMILARLRSLQLTVDDSHICVQQDLFFLGPLHALTSLEIDAPAQPGLFQEEDVVRIERLHRLHMNLACICFARVPIMPRMRSLVLRARECLVLGPNHLDVELPVMLRAGTQTGKHGDVNRFPLLERLVIQDDSLFYTPLLHSGYPPTPQPAEECDNGYPPMPIHIFLDKLKELELVGRIAAGPICALLMAPSLVRLTLRPSCHPSDVLAALPLSTLFTVRALRIDARLCDREDPARLVPFVNPFSMPNLAVFHYTHVKGNIDVLLDALSLSHGLVLEEVDFSYSEMLAGDALERLVHSRASWRPGWSALRRVTARACPSLEPNVLPRLRTRVEFLDCLYKEPAWERATGCTARSADCT